VRHSLLWRRIEEAGLGRRTVEVLQELYRDVSCSVRTRGGLTRTFGYTVGVKQGCVLSPTLFNIFINKLDSILRQSEEVGIEVGDLVVYVLLYADDVVLTADSVEDLQTLLRGLDSFCVQSCMRVNIDKTKLVVFDSSRREREVGGLIDDLACKEGKVERATSYKYLGIIFDEKLTFGVHVEMAIAKAWKAFHALRRQMARFVGMGVRERLDLYNKMVLSVLLYGAEVWYPMLTKRRQQEVELFHRRSLKILLGMSVAFPNATLHCLLGTQPILQQVQDRVLAFLGALEGGGNTLALPRAAMLNVVSSAGRYRSFLLDADGGLGGYAALDPDVRTQLLHECRLRVADRHGAGLVQELQANSKLEFFNQLFPRGGTPGFKSFISRIVNGRTRAAVLRFLGGCHQLNVNLGRRRGEHRQARVCRFCNGGQAVEDERHVFFECGAFAHARARLQLELRTTHPLLTLEERHWSIAAGVLFSEVASKGVFRAAVELIKAIDKKATGVIGAVV
jgi:hypothetical protein